MGSKSAIEWTEATWNPLTGCTRVSAGCDNCYAARQAAGRLKNTPAYEGLAVITPSGRAAFNGKIRLLPDRLDQPLRWQRPRRVFVNSMSDLFHPDVPEEFIDEVFAVMALADRHVFQVLTKRPERMAAYLNDHLEGIPRWVFVEGTAQRIHYQRTGEDPSLWLSVKLPLPNVCLGTSVEDQAAADERIPHLLRTPAAVRFLSCEPLLGPVDLTRIGCWRGEPLSALEEIVGHVERPPVDWVIVGGESGPRSRPFDVAWARSLVAQCRAARVPVFVKQLGANVRDRNDAGFDGIVEWYADTGEPTDPTCWPDTVEVEHDPNGFSEEYQGAPVRVLLNDRKGGDPEEWPYDLRVREIPT